MILEPRSNAPAAYNPTRILRSSQADFAYIFCPTNDDQHRFQLLSLDLTRSITPSTIPDILSSDLPFLKSSSSLAFTPVIDAAGNLTVLAGDCTNGSSGLQVWRYGPTASTSFKTSQWTEFRTSLIKITQQNIQLGSNFLAGALSFSRLVKSTDADTKIYSFGGMCPKSSQSSLSWTANAVYSNLMLTVGLDATTDDTLDYDVSLATNRGPPIAEAGFSVTALPPALSVNSSDAPQTRQQNFVLLGGHTQTAFINMSQIATYSLPQEAWTFSPISQPQNTNDQVEPRSGHTTILSEDGTRLFVYGGWVGDVSTPAQPQYAVLSMRTDSNGQASWSWEIPTPKNTPGASASGLYGHGALLLPGNVMMIYGGFEMTVAGGKRSLQNNILLYNTSSDTWLDSYEPPLAASNRSASSSSTKSSNQVGLGVGLGIGIAFLLLLLSFVLWYTRRLRRLRADGRSVLLSRSSASTFHDYHVPQLPSTVVEEVGFSSFWNNWYGASPQSRSLGMPSISEEKSLMGVSGQTLITPTPPQGMRRKLSGRSYTYHAALNSDDSRLIHSSGLIHPIAELENEDGADSAVALEQERTPLNSAEEKLQEVEAVLKNPFADPAPDPLRSHPVVHLAPFNATRQSLFSDEETIAFKIPRKPVPLCSAEAQRLWREENDLGETFIWNRNGRTSPTKTEERTSSTLSDRSFISNSSIARTMSAKTGTILAAAAARIIHHGGEYSRSDMHSSTTTTSSVSNRSPTYSAYRGRLPQGETAMIHNTGSDTDSCITTRSNFLLLQSEGQGLLGGRPPLDPDDPYQRAMAAANPAYRPSVSNRYDASGLPLSSRQSRPSILGSLRRALNAVAMGGVYDRTNSLTTSERDRYQDEKRAASSSPNKERAAGIRVGQQVPRRAASDGGALLRQKRGAKDWQDGKQWPPYRDDPDAGDWGEPRTSIDVKQAEEEWDVEGAAAERDIQIMFSVPKTRLRVVNADVDRVSIRSVSDGVLSRTGSLKHPIGIPHRSSARSLLQTGTDRSSTFAISSGVNPSEG